MIESLATTRFPLNRLCREQLVLVLERCRLEETLRLVHVNKSLRAHIIDYGPWPRRVDKVRIVARPTVTSENDELMTDYLYVEVHINQKYWLFRPGALLIYDPRFYQQSPECYVLPDGDAVGRLIGKIRSCQRLSIALVTECANPWERCFRRDLVRPARMQFFELAPRSRVSLTACLPRAQVVRNFSLHSVSLHLSALIINHLRTNVIVETCELNLGAEEEETGMVAEALDLIGRRALVKRCHRLVLEDLKSPSISDLLVDVTPSILFLLVNTIDAYSHYIQAFMEHASRGTSIWSGGDEEMHLIIYFTGPLAEITTFSEIDGYVLGAGQYESISAQSSTARQYFDWLFLNIFAGDERARSREPETYMHTRALMSDWLAESPNFADISALFEFTRRCFYRRREPALGKEFLIVNTESMCRDKKRRIASYMRATRQAATTDRLAQCHKSHSDTIWPKVN